MAVFGAQCKMWEKEFGLPNGLDAVAVGNVYRPRWFIGGECGARGSAVAVVMACSRVSNGNKVAVIMW